MIIGMEPFSLSDHYTEMLAGKTVRLIEHHHYGDLKITFTDGTRFSFTPSGAPPTIFVDRARATGPLARVFRV
jgi:hypothetical protein